MYFLPFSVKCVENCTIENIEYFRGFFLRKSAHFSLLTNGETLKFCEDTKRMFISIQDLQTFIASL